MSGVDNTPQRNLFLEKVSDRSAPTLRSLIEKHVLPGSIIYTDKWAGYRTKDLKALGMTHDTVNHKLYFKDPVTGVCTNTIERTWSGIKYRIDRRHYKATTIQDNLYEYIFRRRHEKNLWSTFLEALQKAHQNMDLDELNESFNEVQQGFTNVTLV